MATGGGPELENNMRNGFKFTALMLAGALALAGCQTVDPYTGQPQTSNTTQGAILGALGGAAIGALTNRNQAGRNALIGAGIGALAGGAVGNYMDQQEAALRDELRTSGVSVTRAGDNIYLNMQDDILFDVNSADLSFRSRQVIQSVARVLQEFDQSYVSVNGFTDTTGAAAYNQQLSQRRAEAVANQLVSDGVSPVRISPRGYGETNLRIQTPDNVNEPRNRRVEIVIEPFVG